MDGQLISKNSILDVVLVHKGLTCFVGSGGKTSLIRALAYDLSKTAKVIVATTTKMFPPEEMSFIDGGIEAVREILAKRNPVCTGVRTANGKIRAPISSFSDLCSLADYVLVEADGAKHFPLKIPNETEPVYPKETSGIVCVLGLSAIGKSFHDACFRSERIKNITVKNTGDIITATDAATLVLDQRGVLWNMPDGTLVSVVCNQADFEKDILNANEIAAILNANGFGRVSVVSLKKDFGGKYARFC